MNILYVTYAINGLLMIALPLALATYLTRRFRLGWRLFWIGAATFMLSQALHIPFNFVVLNTFLADLLDPSAIRIENLVLAGILAGLSAGVFEEFARYFIYRWWAKDARSWRKGLLLGAGHGGIEAIIFGGLALYGYLQLVALRNADLTTLVAPDQVAALRQQVTAYWSAPWYASLLGAVERAFTIPAHLALSVLILQVFVRKQSRWLWLAVVWHTVLDGVSVVSIRLWGVYVTEGLIGLTALINLWIIFALRQPEGEEPEREEADKQPFAFPSFPILEETSENLERTRYD